VTISDFLSEPLVRPAVRAALFKVAAGIPGVDVLGEIRDPAGRTGIGVALTARSRGWVERRVVIFEETTARVLAEKVVVLEAASRVSLDTPVVLDSRIYGRTGVVPSLEARPDGPLRTSLGGQLSTFR
jgi:hypothetical protein